MNISYDYNTRRSKHYFLKAIGEAAPHFFYKATAAENH